MGPSLLAQRAPCQSAFLLAGTLDEGQSHWKNSGKLEPILPRRRLFRCCCNMCCKKDDDPEAGYLEPALLVSGPMVTVIKVRTSCHLGSLE